MDTPTPKHLERWRKIRAKGKRHFVLMYGVLGFGLTAFALSTVADYYGHAAKFASNSGHFWEPGFSLLLWFLIGFGWGLWMWRYMERRLSE